MTRMVIEVTCYLRSCKRRRPVLRGESEYEYEVWLVFEIRLQADIETPVLLPVTDLSADAAAGWNERLRQAAAEVTADRIEERIWKAGSLSEQEAAVLIANLPETVTSMTAAPLQALAGGFGIPGVAASFGADVAATTLLKPVLEPLDTAVHAFEVVGVVVGLLTGLHPLVVTCLKCLAHDKLGSLLTGALEHVGQVTGGTAERPPVAEAAGAADSLRTATEAGVSARPGPSRKDELVRETIEPVSTSTLSRPAARVVGKTGPGPALRPDPETEKLFHQADESARPESSVDSVGIAENFGGTAKAHRVVSRVHRP